MRGLTCMLTAFVIAAAAIPEADACRGGGGAEATKPFDPAAGRTDYERALAAEKAEKSDHVIKLYIQAARAGSALAAKRLSEIYEYGLLGRPRDYAESLKWYNTARKLGADVPLRC
jgi:TPR repeat protein